MSEIEKVQLQRKIIRLAPDQPEFRILVVDDLVESRLGLVKLLSEVGFQVREAANGQQAIDVWENWQPHLIWMDMWMPVMDGAQATKQIKARTGEERQLLGNFWLKIPRAKPLDPEDRETVIIALTASGFEEDRLLVWAAGCDDFVSKPLPEEVIFEKIAFYLGVRYIYENINSQSIVSHQTCCELTAADLGVMPTEWLEQLHQASEGAFEKEIFQLIEEIPEEHSGLAEALVDLVNNFRLDRIIKLIETLFL